MGVNSLPKTVTRQRRGCDLNPGPTAPESSTLTTRLPSSRVLFRNAVTFTVYNFSQKTVLYLRCGSRESTSANHCSATFCGTSSWDHSIDAARSPRQMWIDRRLLSTGPTDRQTDRQTDIRPLHRPCSAMWAAATITDVD